MTSLIPKLNKTSYENANFFLLLQQFDFVIEKSHHQKFSLSFSKSGEHHKAYRPFLIVRHAYRCRKLLMLYFLPFSF